jgi:predicted dehydrogenase
MTKKGKYGVGIFGIGWVAHEHIKGYMNNPKCEIIALASRKRETAESKKAELSLDCDILNSYDELMKRDDIDIISMCSPNFLRAEEIAKACEAGKHFFAEKPVAQNIDELKLVKKAYEEAKRKHKIKTVVGFVTEYHAMFRCIKSLIEKGAFGDIFYMETDYWHEIGPWWHGWRWKPYSKAHGPSMMLQGGCHSVGVLMRVCGEVEEVFGYGTNGHRPEYEFHPTVSASVKFKNGAIGKTGGSFEIVSPYLINIIIHGSKGSVINDQFYTREVFAGQEGYQTFNCELLKKGEVEHLAFGKVIDSFVDDIVNDVDSKIRLDYAIKVHEVCMAIDKSIDTGEKVILPLL